MIGSPELEEAKKRRRDGQSWFNGRRGVRNFIMLAVVLFIGFGASIPLWPPELQCSVLARACSL
jgi:hypothetical protein